VKTASLLQTHICKSASSVVPCTGIKLLEIATAYIAAVYALLNNVKNPSAPNFDPGALPIVWIECCHLLHEVSIGTSTAMGEARCAKHSTL
jgi:hypothetical protein